MMPAPAHPRAAPGPTMPAERAWRLTLPAEQAAARPWSPCSRRQGAYGPGTAAGGLRPEGGGFISAEAADADASPDR